MKEEPAGPCPSLLFLYSSHRRVVRKGSRLPPRREKREVSSRASFPPRLFSFSSPPPLPSLGGARWRTGKRDMSPFLRMVDDERVEGHVGLLSPPSPPPLFPPFLSFGIHLPGDGLHGGHVFLVAIEKKSGMDRAVVESFILLPPLPSLPGPRAERLSSGEAQPPLFLTFLPPSLSFPPWLRDRARAALR